MKCAPGRKPERCATPAPDFAKIFAERLKLLVADAAEEEG
jgi:hypothetical protein